MFLVRCEVRYKQNYCDYLGEVEAESFELCRVALKLMGLIQSGPSPWQWTYPGDGAPVYLTWIHPETGKAYTIRDLGHLPETAGFP